VVFVICVIINDETIEIVKNNKKVRSRQRTVQFLISNFFLFFLSFRKVVSNLESKELIPFIIKISRITGIILKEVTQQIG